MKRHRSIFFIVLVFVVFQLIPICGNSAEAQGSSFISQQSNKLYYEGQVYRFTGINAYELASDHGGNSGCGSTFTDQQLNDFFSSLQPYSMVRMWAFQGSMAVNVNTRQIDWTYLDRVVNAASAHNIKLILTLSDQGGVCDDNYWHGLAWYQGGYTADYNSSADPLSYAAYVQQIVTHYVNNSTVAMWEPVNEPEASSCSTPTNGSSCWTNKTCNSETAAANALLSFFNAVGAEIKHIDANHLISSGLIGSGQCGTSGSDYQMVNNSQYINVASYHDYNADGSPLPGDQYNGLQVRINQMNQINKPLIVGEVGIHASNQASGCDTLDQRVSQMQAKLTAMFRAGVAGFIPWDFVPGNTTTCSYDINPGDPLLGMLSQYAFVFQAPTPPASSTPSTPSPGTAPGTSSTSSTGGTNGPNSSPAVTSQHAQHTTSPTLPRSVTPASHSARHDLLATPAATPQKKKPSSTQVSGIGYGLFIICIGAVGAFLLRPQLLKQAKHQRKRSKGQSGILMMHHGMHLRL
ncbi:MAG TPA: hypothetical protein VGS08_01190 [Candidatus Saccharimonadales bacterium]|nr:hypothetical protein [Candidatus Saccharimonadales bacterium]